MLQKKSIDVYIVAGLLVLLVAVVILSLLYRNSTLNQDHYDSVDIPSYAEDTSNLIPVTAPDNIIIKDNNVTLTNDWLVTSVMLEKTFEDMQCKDLSEKCLFYKVTRGDSSFYVSDKELIPAINVDGEDYNISALTFDTPNGSKDFNHFSSLMYVPDGPTTTDENGYINVTAVRTETQISGCIADNLCISTNVLPSESEVNKSSLEIFQNLLSSIVINPK